MTATERDRAALMRAILEDPSDDVARLAFADWCEENSQVGRAAFVRDHIHWLSGSDDFDYLDADLERWCPWLARHDEVGFMRDFGEIGADERGIVVVHSRGEKTWWSRGFIWRVGLPMKSFMADDWRLAGQLFSGHPITAVTLTCRTPNGGGDEAWWSRSDKDAADDPPWWIPRRLFGLMEYDPAITDRPDMNRSYPQEKGALLALSDACVALGRELAGLPPLRHRRDR